MWSFHRGESGGTPVYEGSSDLKIRKLELFDKGFYECRVKSQMGHHEVSSDAVLLVDHENGKRKLPPRVN